MGLILLDVLEWCQRLVHYVMPNMIEKVTRNDNRRA